MFNSTKKIEEGLCGIDAKLSELVEGQQAVSRIEKALARLSNTVLDLNREIDSLERQAAILESSTRRIMENVGRIANNTARRHYSAPYPAGKDTSVSAAPQPAEPAQLQERKQEDKGEEKAIILRTTEPFNFGVDSDKVEDFKRSYWLSSDGKTAIRKERILYEFSVSKSKAVRRYADILGLEFSTLYKRIQRELKKS